MAQSVIFFWHGSCIYRCENKAEPPFCFILKQEYGITA